MYIHVHTCILDALEGNANEDNESSYEPLLGSEQG